MSAEAKKPIAHVVDVLGNVSGRDQPILRMDVALQLVGLMSNDVFLDDDVLFFDPFCKAGELLLSCAFQTCLIKSRHGSLIDLDEISKELYESGRYFALAPDERHYRLSLRTFLGNTFSHDEKYKHIIRNGLYLSEINGELDNQKFEKEFNALIEYIKEKSGRKKIIAVGNPPYQESDGGFGKSARSIYNVFTEALIKSKEISEFVLVIPSRWFGGGKGMDQFRATIRDSRKVKNLRYFKKSSEVFPTVDINGGVCFIHYDKSYSGPVSFSDGENSENINTSEFDIIMDDPKGYQLVRKVVDKWQGSYISSVAWARKPFGLATDYFNRNESVDVSKPNAIPCLSRYREVKNILREDIPKNQDKVDLWKVCVPAVAGGSKGNRRSTIPVNQIFLVPKGTITTETYSVVDVFESKQKALNLIEYLKTDFARYFLGLRKITQHLPRDRWDWVPYVDTSKKWSDEELFDFFGFNKKKREHIRKKVEEWSC